MRKQKAQTGGNFMKKGEVVHTAYGDKVISSRIPVRKVFRKHWLLLVMLIPAVVYVIIFCYVPMSGLVLAFEKYQYRGGIYHSPWVGLQNFKAIMIDGKLPGVTRNTILYNIAFIFLGVVFEMGSAILINELRNKYFKKTAQSFMFLRFSKSI
jgi:putative aldouronate transport system permease protein